MDNKIVEAFMLHLKKTPDAMGVLNEERYLRAAEQYGIADRMILVRNAEQNMLGTAAGLALEGFTPFVFSRAARFYMSSCEQLCADICSQNLRVRIVTFASASAGEEGDEGSVQEDIASLRSVPNLTILTAGSLSRFRIMLENTDKQEGPVYIRMDGNRYVSIPENAGVKFQIGKINIIAEGSEVTLITYGSMLTETLEAAKKLEEKGISVRVAEINMIKPIDYSGILNCARETGKIVTIEDHNMTGGVGSTVAEILAEADIPCRFRRLGIPDVYAGSGDSRSQHKLFRHDADGIVHSVLSIM